MKHIKNVWIMFEQEVYEYLIEYMFLFAIIGCYVDVVSKFIKT